MALEEHVSPISVFASAFTLASFAGLAALLRSGNQITLKTVISACLNSGILSIGIAMLWYTQFSDNVYFLVGICTLAGLGGMTAVDFILTALKKGGFNISIGKDGVKMGESEQEKANGPK